MAKNPRFCPDQQQRFWSDWVVADWLFVLRFYGPVNPMGSCRARSVYLTTRLLGRLSPLKRLTSIVHILSPETDNCPSWISGRERMTVENISWSISTKKCCQPRRGLNPRPPGLQSDGASNWATEGCRLIWFFDVKVYFLMFCLKYQQHFKQFILWWDWGWGGKCKLLFYAYCLSWK